jgi:hypothetical protein
MFHVEGRKKEGLSSFEEYIVRIGTESQYN